MPQFIKQKILKLLNCGPDEDQLRAAIIKRDALGMEAAAEAMQVQVVMSMMLQPWDDTLLHVPGTNKLEWLAK